MPSIVPAAPGDPERIACYRILGRLGSGGMGTVYAALGPQGRRVAVKVIHPQHAAEPEFRARFHREVEVLRRVAGPCLVPLLDAAPAADIPWLATDYVPGPTLQQHLTAHGPLAPMQLHLLAAGTASALAAIHAQGVVHRDLKPTNVILTPQGPRVLDFGIAHVADGTAITRTGMLTGTPGWISPEHYRDSTVSPPGDVFTWGALVAYAATGRLPFGSGAADAVAFRVMREQPNLEGAPDDLRELLESCMAKDPQERPTAATLAERTTELLGRQATQVLDRGPVQTTAVEEVLASQWHIPEVDDDPAWTIAPRRNTRRVAWLAASFVLILAAAMGAWAATAMNSHSDTGTRPSTEPASVRETARKPSPATSPPPVSSPPAARAVSTPSQVAPSPTPSVGRTQVTTIAPWAVGGYPADDITVTGETVGSCWSSSEATMRLDSWRCIAEDQILDPCFAPDESPEHEALLCMGTQPNRMVRLTLTEPLPGNNFHIPGGPQVTPLLIILADGNACRTMTGATTVLAGERMIYGCEEGGHLYGEPDKSNALWTISYRAEGAGASVSTPIAHAYQ
ncbi:serine/threonine-protein kinase [Streptomyces sp. NPDC047980]|uniref:serine/threonine-protein kinase n=1 Tax=Streptomyces sp. NPDC047980 TaxID=3365494 RepID=UPI003721CF54